MKNKVDVEPRNIKKRNHRDTFLSGPYKESVRGDQSSDSFGFGKKKKITLQEIGRKYGLS